jgi:hypothetical protein
MPDRQISARRNGDDAQSSRYGVRPAIIRCGVCLDQVRRLVIPAKGSDDEID